MLIITDELKINVLLFVFMFLFCLMVFEIFLIFDFYSSKPNQITSHFYKSPQINSYFNGLISKSKMFLIERKWTYIIPDKFLGWKIGDNRTRLHTFLVPNALYESNSMGIRSPREFDLEKKEGIIRIHLYGDSFVHGNDVPFEETMGYYLEKILNETMEIEIMNFGVEAYGIDQAYLKWKIEGREYQPDYIIIGYQPENCQRNVNIISELYFRHNFFITKPRFIIENESLKLINYPTLNYTKIPEILKNIYNWDLLEYECYYDSYRGKNCDGTYKSNLCYKIIETWVEEISKESEVYVVYLPPSGHLHGKYLTNVSYSSVPMNSNSNIDYYDVSRRIEKVYGLINPEIDLVNELKKTSMKNIYVGGDQHFTGKANKIVAENIYKFIWGNNNTITPLN